MSLDPGESKHCDTKKTQQTCGKKDEWFYYDGMGCLMYISVAGRQARPQPLDSM